MFSMHLAPLLIETSGKDKDITFSAVALYGCCSVTSTWMQKPKLPVDITG